MAQVDQPARNPACERSLMNRKDIESPIGLDRLATVDEVFWAESAFSQGVLKPLSTSHSRNLPEDLMWLAFVSEIPASISN